MIYVTQDTRLDLTPARAAIGEEADFVILAPFYKSRAPERRIDPETLVPQMRATLAGFNPDRDYLLAVGDPAVINLAGALVAEVATRYRLLIWDRYLATYYVHEFDLMGGTA